MSACFCVALSTGCKLQLANVFVDALFLLYRCGRCNLPNERRLHLDQSGSIAASAAHCGQRKASVDVGRHWRRLAAVADRLALLQQTLISTQVRKASVFGLQQSPSSNFRLTLHCFRTVPVWLISPYTSLSFSRQLCQPELFEGDAAFSSADRLLVPSHSL